MVQSKAEKVRARWNIKWDLALEELREEVKRKETKTSKAKKKKQGRKRATDKEAEEPLATADPLEIIDCPICLEKLEKEEEKGDEAYALKPPSCTHDFHSSCILSWLRKSESKGWPLGCPMCRTQNLGNGHNHHHHHQHQH